VPLSVRARRVLLLSGFAAGWVAACFFAVALVSVVVGMAAQVLGRPSLATNTVFTVAVEAFVHFMLAVVAFWLLKTSSPPRWYWIVAPLGYLVAFGSFLVVMRLLDNTDAMPTGRDWAFVAADVAATGLGAWLVLRPPPEATADAAEGPGESREPA
jgi:hypothetical protein